MWTHRATTALDGWSPQRPVRRARERDEPRIQSLDQDGLATHQKKPAVEAALIFLDESGLLMAPVVRRTWSPCGQTPIVVQRTRHHQKVSVIAALIISPRGAASACAGDSIRQSISIPPRCGPSSVR